MNLQLSKEKIYEILSYKQFSYDNKTIINMLLKTKENTLNFLNHLLEGNINGYERNDLIGLINPLIWEFGHTVSFYEHKTLKLLNPNGKYKFFLENSENIYDSFLINREDRFSAKLHELSKIKYCYEKTVDSIINFINAFNEPKLNPIYNYLIMLGILHNEMHNESFLFSRQLLGLSKPKNLKFIIDSDENIYEDIEFIDIEEGYFIQGADDNIEKFTFDNEKPCFKTKINSFRVSKYPITQWQFLQFIKNNCYKKKEYWCEPGWRWIKKNKIDKPVYWIKKDNEWFVKKWDKIIPIQYNHPMINVSWYEACAYCRWKKVRLPKESEWEYLSTNKGSTKYPWGDSEPNINRCNLNYNNGGTVNIFEFKCGNNKNGVSQLFGNVWEWCQEPIYPYNGFEIDPVYREMSYPFFGFKRICKGGCWAVPSFLINSRYRNAQMPNCRMQFIGFRVCKDI